MNKLPGQAPALKRYERRRLKRKPKERQKREGLNYPPTITLPNRKSGFKTVDEEKESVQRITEETLCVYRQLLPGLLKKLSKIPDPRAPESQMVGFL